MSKRQIPALKRKPPRIFLWLMVIPFYLILLPLNRVLKTLGKSEGIIGLVSKKNIRNEKIKKAFEGYVPDEGDIFVCAFSKSGTNWIMQISHQIAWYGEGDFEHIHDVVTWPDIPGHLSKKLFTPLHGGPLKELSPTGMRVIKTHLAAHYVPYDEKAKYLVVIRDPKEVFVSSYPFYGSVAGPLMPSVEVWLDLFLSKEWPLNFGNTWAEHSASYWALKDKANVLILSYTRLKHDPATGIRQIAEVLGVELNNEQLNKVLEKSSFSYMKAIDHKFIPVPRGSIPWAGDFTMIREGKTGHSSELITHEQQTRIDEHFRQELKDLGSDFPYAEFANE